MRSSGPAIPCVVPAVSESGVLFAVMMAVVVAGVSAIVMLLPFVTLIGVLGRVSRSAIVVTPGVIVGEVMGAMGTAVTGNAKFAAVTNSGKETVAVVVVGRRLQTRFANDVLLVWPDRC